MGFIVAKYRNQELRGDYFFNNFIVLKLVTSLLEYIDLFN